MSTEDANAERAGPQPSGGATTSSTYDEVQPLLEMLSMTKYIPTFRQRGWTTVAQLIEHVKEWKALVPNQRERETLEGYLALRENRPPAEREASERRLKLFDLVRSTLKELRDLQLRKAEMERNFMVQHLKRNPIIGKGSSSASNLGASTGPGPSPPSGQLEDLLDQIDDARERLENAQKELQVLSEENPSLSGKRKPLKASTLKVKRAAPGPSVDVTSPRVAGEPGTKPQDPAEGSDRKAPFVPKFRTKVAQDPDMAASGTRCSSARPAGSSSTTRTGAAGEDRKPGRIHFDFDFASATSGPQHDEGGERGSEQSKPFDPLADRRPLRNFDPKNVGPGWNRPRPVSKTDFWQGVRTKVMVEKHREQMMREQQQQQEEERLSSRGSSRKVGQATDWKELTLTGLKANRFSLGIGVDFNHYHQMRLGATAPEDVVRRPESGGFRTSDGKPPATTAAGSAESPREAPRRAWGSNAPQPKSNGSAPPRSGRPASASRPASAK